MQKTGAPVVGPPSQAKPQGGKKGYSAVGDQWGLLGLPARTEADADVAFPSVGYDFSKLSLNLVSQEFLHPTFSSPWLDAAPRVQPDFRIPSCYFVNPPHLRFSMFQRFQLETLFFVFYSMPRDVLQLAAAQELYNRDWRFHKELRLWFTRPPGVEPSIKTTTYEKGTYLVFNPEKWSKEQKNDFVLVYDSLEEKTQVDTQTSQPGGQPQGPPPQRPPGGGNTAPEKS
jgi:CCR4-NOT transcription complex subunit 2